MTTQAPRDAPLGRSTASAINSENVTVDRDAHERDQRVALTA